MKKINQINKELEKLGQSEIKEPGSAGFNIEISNGIITVTHSDDGSKLAEWEGSGNDWDTIWDTINKLVSQSKGFRVEEE